MDSFTKLQKIKELHYDYEEIFYKILEELSIYSTLDVFDTEEIDDIYEYLKFEYRAIWKEL